MHGRDNPLLPEIHVQGRSVIFVEIELQSATFYS